MEKRKAFTLIELLIVVAIIAILAAIAVPNFLEAQTRAKISRVKSDMRSMATATEAYRVDNTQYPAWGLPYYEMGNIMWVTRQMRLTTPIAYITSLPKDPFRSAHDHNPEGIYDYIVTEFHTEVLGDRYWCTQDSTTPLADFHVLVYIRSFGPDQIQQYPNEDGNGWHLNLAYDPSNGTKSRGEIWALMPGPKYYP
jgi:type II secretion system protein G